MSYFTGKKTCLESLRRWQWHSWGFSLFPRSFWASRLWWKTELRRTRETGHISCRCFAVFCYPRCSVEGRGSFTRWVVGVVICTGSLLKGVFLVSSCPRTITVLREWWSSWHHMTSLSPIARWVKHDPIHTYTDCESSLHFCYRFLWAVGKLGGSVWDAFFRVDLTFSLVRMASKISKTGINGSCFKKATPKKKNLLSLPIPILQTSIFRCKVFVFNGIHADLQPGIDELDQNLRVLVVLRWNFGQPLKR